MTKTDLLTISEEFRQLAEDAWSQETAFPGNYDSQVPSRGQCGVTSYGMGLWLMQEKGFEVGTLCYARGYLLDMRNPNGATTIADNHGWLHVTDDEGQSWQVDLTADQYPEVTGTCIVQEQGVFGDYPILHVIKEGGLTPIEDYDTTKFQGRLETFAGSLGLRLL